ncbi:SDR family oxidoreductase [Glaciimonas sp. PCH181]|uniref:SDR family oxidoreductase n=1 Tax=Glaciimonas sp. PCH181 TaxID=2133943 RepID=UPI000D35DBA2|nr:SDR family oxidoreductase [Glaciimonas sp. PCH181]PUA20299.1 NAD(P)-dependent oxidoreductase [Glaciimonas sp. PCH181]
MSDATSASPQQEQQPGIQAQMQPQPTSEPRADPSGKMARKIAFITGGDSGIGRAVALAFAKEGARVAIGYYDEHEDALETQRLIVEEGGECLLIAGDIGSEDFCRDAIKSVIAEYGRLDVLVNNAAQQYPTENIEDISQVQLEKTFRTNIFSMFYLVKAALPYLTAGARIINTASVTAYRGSPHLLDYAATKGAIVAFTRSLAQKLVKREIHVNAVAPGPVWTPLISATFSEEKIRKFGKETPMERPGQPDEIAPSYVFLATEGASYMTGQVLHPNGGEIING